MKRGIRLTANESAALAFIQNYPSSESIPELLADKTPEFVALARVAQEEARSKAILRGKNVLHTKLCRCRCGNLHKEL